MLNARLLEYAFKEKGWKRLAQLSNTPMMDASRRAGSSKSLYPDSESCIGRCWECRLVVLRPQNLSFVEPRKRESSVS